jgi:hypothetical protein
MMKPEFLAIITLTALLTGCGSTEPTLRPASLAQTTTSARISEARDRHLVPASGSKDEGLYASALVNSKSFVYGYPRNNKNNQPPVCSESVSVAGNVAVDAEGDLIVPGGYTVSVFRGPDMCGPMIGTLSTGSSGYAVDAASADAANGTIAVAAIQNGSGPGSIELCTLKAGCTRYLRGTGMNIVYGIAMAKDGDCWASWEQGPSKSYAAYLTYFKACSGNGERSTGYQNPSAGGIDIDRSGNIVAISYSTSAVYVYSGCKPKCRLLAGPLSLHGAARYGHLDEQSNRLATADSQHNKIDIYAYNESSLSYLYSFNRGLPKTSGAIGAAYNPRSKE